MTGVDQSNAAKALQSIGVDVIDQQTHQLRDMDSILSDVSKKWNNLTADQKAYVSFNAAATRQYSMFEAIMQGYGKSTDLATQALNANGYALQQQDTYMQSTEAHINTLKSTITSMWQNTISSGSLNTAITGITGIAEAFSKVTTTIGLIPTVLTTASIALSLFKKEWTALSFTTTQGIFGNASITNGGGLFNNLVENLKDFGTKYTETMQNNMRLNSYFAGDTVASTSKAGVAFEVLTGKTVSQTVATVGATVATVAFNAALTLGLSLAITAVVSSISNLISTTQKQQEAFNKLAQSIQQLTTENAQIPSLISSYDELSNKTNKTTDDKQKLADVTQKLTQLFPEAISGFDAEGKAILGDTSYIQQLAKEKEHLLDLQKQQLATQFTSQGGSDFSNLQKMQAQMNELAQEKKKYEEDLNSGNSLNQKYDTERIATYTKLMADLETQIQKQQGDLVSLANGFLQVGDNAKLFSQGAINELISNLSKLDNVSKDQFSSLFNSLNSSKDATSIIDSWNSSLQDLKNTHATTSEAEKQHTQAVDSLTASIINQNQNISPDTVKAFASAILTMGQNSDQAKTSVDSVTTAVENIGKATDDYLKQQDDLAQAIAKVNEGHKLTAVEIYNLVKAHPELASAITNENGLLSLNKSAIQDVMNANDAAFKDKLNSTKADLENQKNALILKLQMFGQEVAGIKSVADAKRLNAELLYGSDEDLVSRKMAGANSSTIDQIQQIEDALKTVGVSAQITPESIINSSAPDLNKAPKKEKTPAQPAYTNPVDALITGTKELYNQSKAYGEIIQKQLDQAKSQKDVNLEIFRTNELLKNQKDQVFKLQESNKSLQWEYYHQISNNPQFSDPTAWINENGEATLTYVRQYNSASVETQKEMQQLFDTISKLRKAWADNDKTISDLNTTQQNLNQTLSDTRGTIADNTITAIKNAYTQEKEIFDKNIDHQIQAEQDRHDLIISHIDEEIRKLDDQANANDYNKNLTKSQTEAQDIQNQINALMLDNSPEAISKRIDLQKQLADKTTSIQDMQQKHDLDLRKQNLNDQKTSEDTQLKNVKDGLDKQKTVQDLAYDNMLNDEKYYADLRVDIINGSLDKVRDKLKELQTDLAKTSKTIADSIGVDFSKLTSTMTGLNTSSSSLNAIQPTVTATGVDASILQAQYGNTIKIVSSGGSIANQAGVAGSDRISTNQLYQKLLGAPVNNISTDQMWGYAAGGINNIPGMHMLHGTNANTETIFNATDGKKLWDFVHNLPNLSTNMMGNLNFKTPNLAGMGGNSKGVGTVNLNFNIANLNGGLDGATQMFNIIDNDLKKWGK